MERYYKHSGKVGLLGIPLGLLVGTAIAIPVSYAYDWSLIHILLDERINAICTILFGIIIGGAIGYGLIWGKVRNNMVAAATGALGGAVALYISWAIWISKVLGSSEKIPGPVTLFTHPKYMWQIILWINHEGTWGWKDSYSSEGTLKMVTGTELWIFWSLEALTIVGFGIFIAYLMAKQKPFCENCNQWCSKTGQIVFAPPPPDMQSPNWRAQLEPDIKQFVENKQFDFLQKAPRYKRQGQPGSYTMQLYSCTQCGALNTLSLIRLQQQRRAARATLVDKLLLTAAEAESLRRFVQPAQSGAAVAGK